MDGRTRRPRSDAQQRRQKAVELMGSGLSDPQIAAVLRVDPRTIRRYRAWALEQVQAIRGRTG